MKVEDIESESCEEDVVTGAESTSLPRADILPVNAEGASLRVKSNLPLPEDVPLPVETSSEDEAPSAEDTRNTFASIMELIDGGTFGNSSLKESGSGVQSHLDDNLEKLQEHAMELQSHEEGAPRDSETQYSPVLSSDTGPSFPDGLKTTSSHDPLKDEAGGPVEGEVGAQWPDIVIPPEMPDNSGSCSQSDAVSVENLELLPDNTGLGASGFVKSQESSGTGFLMPSALTELHDLQVLDNSVDVQVSNAEPTMIDQEVPMETRSPLESEEGFVRTKTRSRKRSRRGKKKVNNVDVTELLEAPRYTIDSTSLH
jgi:hypothetical protein